jgi:predicted subunit of tRNA(5-methylaminomethyl-2-thiouridylate) methyltransferase
MKALDVVRGFDKESMLMPTTNEETPAEADCEFRIVKKDGFLFACVDFCVEEGFPGTAFWGTHPTLMLVLAKRQYLQQKVKSTAPLGFGSGAVL